MRWNNKSCTGLLGAGLLALLLAGCARNEDFYLGWLKRTEPGSGGRETRTTEGLEQSIRRYREEVDRKVKATDQLGVYYRMLAVRYMEMGMYLKAFGALEEARRIYPENPVLFYYAGMCAARLSQAELAEPGKAEWLARSERLYRRALSLDPLHSESMYALAVLYVFELNRPAEAVDLLQRLVEREKKNPDALFLLGNAYYRTGALQEALEAYRRLEGLGLSDDRRRQAAENRKKIEEELYGKR